MFAVVAACWRCSCLPISPRSSAIPPILGSSAYITFLTGNVMNLKLPCAINAMALTETSQGTEEGDTVASLAVAASSVITTVIIAVGVLLLVPLQPILRLPAVQTATTYILPALFGSLFLGMFDNKCGSEYVAKGKLKCVILPMALVLAANCFMSTAGMEGILMLIAMPLIVLSAWVLYKTGQIKMIPVKQSEPASPGQRAGLKQAAVRAGAGPPLSRKGQGPHERI